MRPSDKLIFAWKEFLYVRMQAKAARLKSVSMFRHCTSDPELYRRANDLHRESLRLDKHADVEFRKAIKAEYSKRFYIEWIDEHTCDVWVHAPYAKDAHALRFNKSLRVRKGLQ